VDSSYQQNRPAETRIGIKGMIAGFEEGIKTMRVGGKRRVIVPPDLGPPVSAYRPKYFDFYASMLIWSAFAARSGGCLQLLYSIIVPRYLELLVQRKAIPASEK
jgi:hypothetical protein